MSELIEFLRARYVEEEEAATATLDTSDRIGLLRGTEPRRWRFDAMQVRAGDILIVKHTWPYEGAHMTLWDPARALREVAAKRELLNEHYGFVATLNGSTVVACRRCSDRRPDVDLMSHYEPWLVLEPSPCLTLHLLAQIYADHPDFKEDWKP